MKKKLPKFLPKNLRKTFPEFFYNRYAWSFKNKDLLVSFDFSAGKNKFTAKVKIKNIPASAKKIKKEIIDNFVFNLGMIENFSYWKAFCSPKIIVKCGGMEKEQIDWWHNLLIKGMGQYFFENKINFKTKNFVQIISEKNPIKPILFKASKDDFLLPIGGGKDSLTSYYLLNKKKNNSTFFFLNPTKAGDNTNNIFGNKNSIICEREIDPALLSLNKKGYLNGHTPFVAYLSFLTALSAVIFNKKYIIFSNEKSSNEGNIEYLEEEINHQYSKTFDFENKFRDYLKKYLSSNIEYFSLLRPLYELQIAKIFSERRDFLPIFLSCNESQKTYSGTKEKTGTWCGSCAKCLFVYSILYPFVSNADLKNIFGKDLFTKKELLPLLFELVEEKEIKPWECVGTRREARVALYLGWKRNVIRDLEQPYLLEFFAENLMSQCKDWEKEAETIMNNWDNKNNIPSKFKYQKQIKL